MNSVANIKSLVDADKVTEAVRTELKKLGPPRPALVNIQETPVNVYKIHLEKFNPELYNLADWLCGCPQRNALFCYICLVMSKCADRFNGESYYWVISGVTREITCKPKLLQKINKHQTTPQHMSLSLDYALLGENNVLHHLRGKFFLSVTQHNEKVRLNRHILSKLINCVKCAGVGSDYKAEMKQILKDNSTLVSDIFRDFFDTIWCELLNSIHAVCVSLIQQEIARTDFVSMEVDEVNSIGSPVMLVFIVRYELHGEIHERFLKYIVTQSNQVLNMPYIILCELDKLATINKAPENFISISYNGLASIFTGRSGVHSKLKDRFKKIYFIHSYAHNIDFVIEGTGSLGQELRIFFINLKSFQTFFSRSEKYINMLDTIVSKLPNRKLQTGWNFQATSPTLLTVCSHKSDIRECLDQIIDLEVERSTIAEAVALKNLLNNDDFNYWLDLFSKLLPTCNELFDVVHELTAFDAVQVRTIVENFKTKMYNVRNNIEVNPPPIKRPCIEEVYIKEEVTDELVVSNSISQAPPTQDLRQITRTEMVNRIFYVIMAYIEERVTPSPFILLASLIHPGFFAKYRIAFPRAEVEQVARLFSLDKDALSAELRIIYEREELTQAEGSLFLLQYLYKNSLADVFPETFKLLKMVCTVPMTTSDPGRCFSTLKQIKSFLKNSNSQEKIEVLTMCLLEKDLMKKTPNFNELVIEHLCRQKNGELDFSCFAYKQLY
ncbi:hypothetical protein Zmor_015604 [Zophobas morio]|uniref:HAT C-terminal dimerisation domain-containing protein n=1 Tax=Zophobas morio TaxID=2755281 RepID=A0AA38IEI2_9CUCU|nr:hypothetical protein Zmor_015604 [Zophobas morio]